MNITIAMQQDIKSDKWYRYEEDHDKAYRYGPFDKKSDAIPIGIKTYKSGTGIYNFKNVGQWIAVMKGETAKQQAFDKWIVEVIEK